MKDVTGRIMAHAPLKADYWTLALDVGPLADLAQPGQFVHIRIPALERAALRRPFSIFDAENGCLKILYKTIGRGTGMMTHLQAGDTLQVIGPLGNGFPLVPKGIPFLVAGGYGVAPLCFLARRLKQKGKAFIGGRTSDDILATETLQALGWEVFIATQDGSAGETGLVTQPLDREIARAKACGLQPEFYACGPDGMLKAVGQRALDHQVNGWLSLDKHMVCGVGACLACVQKLLTPDGTPWTGRVCHDGPIFEARTIIW